MIIRCIDVETLGLEAADGVCEVGWCDVGRWHDNSDPIIGKPQSMLVNPGKPIPPRAMGVHHITDADVAGAPPLSEVFGAVLSEVPLAAMAAHNAKFEKMFLDAGAVPWICTYKIAYHLAPDAPDHQLQTLRYWLGLTVNPALAVPPHRAGPDAYVCAHLVARILKKMALAEMIDISSRPILLTKLRFGVHAGKPVAEIPPSYWQWLLYKSSGPWDENIVFTAKTMLGELG